MNLFYQMGESISAPSIAVDANNYAHVVIEETREGWYWYLEYSRFPVGCPEAAGWDTLDMALFSPGDSLASPCISLSEYGFPHVCWEYGGKIYWVLVK